MTCTLYYKDVSRRPSRANFILFHTKSESAVRSRQSNKIDSSGMNGHHRAKWHLRVTSITRKPS